VSDFLAAIADHLNRTPSLCICGHPSVLHVDVGCIAIPWGEGPPCVCDDTDGAQWDADHPDGEISDEEAAAMAEYSAEGRDR
jgi:hypothetical protein